MLIKIRFFIIFPSSASERYVPSCRSDSANQNSIRCLRFYVTLFGFASKKLITLGQPAWDSSFRHRFWLLRPAMLYTHLGMVDTYSLRYVRFAIFSHHFEVRKYISFERCPWDTSFCHITLGPCIRKVLFLTFASSASQNANSYRQSLLRPYSVVADLWELWSTFACLSSAHISSYSSWATPRRGVTRLEFISGSSCLVIGFHWLSMKWLDWSSQTLHRFFHIQLIVDWSSSMQWYEWCWPENA